MVTNKWMEQYDRALAWTKLALVDYTTAVVIDGWGAFQEFIQTQAAGDQWFFRGQSDSKWKLRPSLERVTIYPILSPSAKLSNWCKTHTKSRIIYAESFADARTILLPICLL